MPDSAFDPGSLLAASTLGVLATLKSNGHPQLSPVQIHVDIARNEILVATGGPTAKTANIRRDPRVALEVTSADTWSWATAEGTATLSGPGTDPHGPEVDALVDYYRRAAGEHPDWDEYRAVMVAEGRILITIRIEHMYGAKLN